MGEFALELIIMVWPISLTLTEMNKKKKSPKAFQYFLGCKSDGRTCLHLSFCILSRELNTELDTILVTFFFSMSSLC